MAIPDEDLINIREEVGDTPDDATLTEIWDRRHDWVAVVREVLKLRLANLVAAPAQFDVSGEYSQNTGANIKALTQQLANLPAEDDDSGDALGTVRLISPPDPACR